MLSPAYGYTAVHATNPQGAAEIFLTREDIRAKFQEADKLLKTVHLSPEEVDLMLEAIQVAKYPDRPRPKPSLDKHERLDRLRGKLQD